MIYINNKNILEELRNKNNYCVIIDFDRTLTTGASDASLGIIPQFLGGECLKERLKNYEYYRPLELDYTMGKEEKRKIMREWATKTFTILSKYLTSEDIIVNSLKDANMHLRKGVKEFFKEMYEKNIPVVIMSAGVGNLIEEFLKKEEVLHSNITLISNFFEFKDNKTYIDTEKLMASSNKDYSKIPEDIRKILDKKENILLFGDIVEDIRMIDTKQRDKTLAIGFLDHSIDINLDTYNNNFDIVLTDNEDFNTVIEILRR